jgi:exopolysaccharide biosynthesis polyprenyl glycosylphosphotransferase
MNHHFLIKSSPYRNYGKELYRLYFGLVELMLICISFPVSVWILKVFFLVNVEIKTGVALFFFALILISWVVISRMMALSKIPRAYRFPAHIFQFAKITIVVLLGLITVKILFRLTSIPVLLVVLCVSIIFIFTLLFRIINFKAMNAYRSFGLNEHRVLIIADAFSDGIIQALMNQKEWGYKVVSLLTDSKLIRAKYGPHIQILSGQHRLKSVIDHSVIDEVIYCKRNLEIDLIREVAALCNEIGVIFRMQSSISPLDPIDFQLKTFRRRKDLSLVDTPSSSISLLLKTMTDIYFPIMALIILIPLFIILAVVIKMSSRGPVFFKQERIGRRGRKFNIYKFRTMVLHAEDQIKNLKFMNEADGPVFKIKHDPRITRIGRVLRNTGLDELPQLYNVMKGEMSLIGPRPPLEVEVSQYERWQLRRLSVKPGITCLWQVVPNRHDVTFEEWMELDLHYIDNWNIARDLVLFIQTIRTFFRAGGH